jgi:hypothetical protein
MTATLLGMVLGSSLQGAFTGATHDRPLRDRVALALTSERSTYYVGEVVHLRVSLHNFSSEAVLGAFTLPPVVGKTRVLYQRDDAPFAELSHLDARHDSFQEIVRLAPDQTISHDFVVAYNGAPEALLFSEAGDYRFMVRYRDLDGPNALLVSEPLGVTVVNAPADQEAALAAYRQGLAFFAQPFPRHRGPSTAQIQAAAQFLESWPESLYSAGVRNGLYAALNDRVVAGIANEAERALFKKINAE